MPSFSALDPRYFAHFIRQQLYVAQTFAETVVTVLRTYTTLMEWSVGAGRDELSFAVGSEASEEDQNFDLR